VNNHLFTVIRRPFNTKEFSTPGLHPRTKLPTTFLGPCSTVYSCTDRTNPAKSFQITRNSIQHPSGREPTKKTAINSIASPSRFCQDQASCKIWRTYLLLTQWTTACLTRPKKNSAAPAGNQPRSRHWPGDEYPVPATRLNHLQKHQHSQPRTPPFAAPAWASQGVQLRDTELGSIARNMT